jgi:hypothetical protein
VSESAPLTQLEQSIVRAMVSAIVKELRTDADAGVGERDEGVEVDGQAGVFSADPTQV